MPNSNRITGRAPHRVEKSPLVAADVDADRVGLQRRNERERGQFVIVRLATAHRIEDGPQPRLQASAYRRVLDACPHAEGSDSQSRSSAQTAFSIIVNVTRRTMKRRRTSATTHTMWRA